jgi:hypothetical protein
LRDNISRTTFKARGKIAAAAYARMDDLPPQIPKQDPSQPIPVRGKHDRERKPNYQHGYHERDTIVDKRIRFILHNKVRASHEAEKYAKANANAKRLRASHHHRTEQQKWGEAEGE